MLVHQFAVKGNQGFILFRAVAGDPRAPEDHIDVAVKLPVSSFVPQQSGIQAPRWLGFGCSAVCLGDFCDAVFFVLSLPSGFAWGRLRLFDRGIPGSGSLLCSRLKHLLLDGVGLLVL